jgi:hypothetical protein
MARVGIVSSVVVMALGLAIGSAAYAQKPTSATSTTTGAFNKLSTGNQKVASALFQAQNGTTSTPLTLDEIAAKKQGGQGWGEVFKGMQAQGLVQEKNLGQVVSKYNDSTKGVSSSPGNNGKGNAFGASNNSGGGAAHGSSKGGK